MRAFVEQQSRRQSHTWETGGKHNDPEASARERNMVHVRLGATYATQTIPPLHFLGLERDNWAPNLNDAEPPFFRLYSNTTGMSSLGDNCKEHGQELKTPSLTVC